MVRFCMMNTSNTNLPEMWELVFFVCVIFLAHVHKCGGSRALRVGDREEHTHLIIPSKCVCLHVIQEVI